MIDTNFNSINQTTSPSAGEASKVTIKELPDEVMLLIFKLLDTPELMKKVSLVDKAWNVLTKNEVLWKALLQRDTNFFQAGGKAAAGKTWKEIYQAEWVKLPDNIEYVRRTVLKNGLKLKAASDRLKDDFDTVKLAVIENKEALKYASDRLKGSPLMKRYQSRAIAKQILKGGVDILLTS